MGVVVPGEVQIDEGTGGGGRLSGFRGVASRLGPGLVTGAADDDPSGIATYSQVGAQFGYALGWTLFLSLPLMIAIQMASGRIGLVTGQGIAFHLRRHMPRWVGLSVVAGLAIANVFNIGADLSAMGDAAALAVGGPGWLWALVAALVSILLEIFVRYRRYQALLKWITLSLLAYVGVVLVVHIPWDEALRGLLLPHIEFGRSSLLALVAVLGTTISPYLFFWQAGQEMEEQRRRGSAPLVEAPEEASSQLRRVRLDTVVGMIISNLIALFIVLATAATLHGATGTSIASAADAALALRPIAGRFAALLFALGIVGTGLLALPVLAGSAAYATAEYAGRPEGLELRFAEARIFYLLIAAAIGCGLALNLLPIPPMTALYWAAILNGLLAAPIMAVVMQLATRRQVMGDFVLPPLLRALGWLGVGVMALTAGATLDQF